MDDVLPFGRHQGYTVKEILKDRPEYIVWLMENTSLKFYKSVQDEINRIAYSIKNAYRPRRRSYIYDGGLRGEHAIDSMIEEWEYDVPW